MKLKRSRPATALFAENMELYDINISSDAKKRFEEDGEYSITTSTLNHGEQTLTIIVKDTNGNVETSSEIISGNTMIKAVATTNTDGTTATRFIKVDLTTGEEEALDSTLSATTPYKAGNKVEILDMNGSVNIKTTTSLTDELIVE